MICPGPNIISAGYIVQYWLFGLGQALAIIIVWELIKFCYRVIDKD